MKGNNMRVITKHLKINDKSFALVCEPNWGELKYGTIPYDELDETERLKRPLNGFEMCVARSINEAIEKRELQIDVEKWMEEHPDADEQERLEAIINTIINSLEAIINIGENIKNE